MDDGDLYFHCESTKFLRVAKNNSFFPYVWNPYFGIHIFIHSSRILSLNLILMVLNWFWCKILCLYLCSSISVSKNFHIVIIILFWLLPSSLVLFLNFLTIWASLFLQNVFLLKSVSYWKRKYSKQWYLVQLGLLHHFQSGWFFQLTQFYLKGMALLSSKRFYYQLLFYM